MFAAWGTWVARFRWPVFAVTLAAVIVAGIWGLGVFGQLTEGGYNDPDSESTRASEVVQKALGAQGGDLLVIYTPARGSIDDAVLQQRVENRLAALPGDAVTSTTSYFKDKAPQYLAADKRSAIAVLTLAGDDDAAKLESFRKVAERLDVQDTTQELAGGVVLADATSERSTRDLAIAEAISLPIVLILLLLIFGSLVAAALPVLVGGAAVLGSLGVLHGVAYAHDVNSFAVNVASLLGLGMAIDYGLFMVGRFREEQEYGRTPAEAVSRTVATAGRTVVFSATLLMIALAGLLLFPQGFLKSLAYGGLAAVALAAILSLTMLPALLAILGPRVDKLPIRLPKRRNARPAGTGWARLAHVVLHRPILVALPIVAGLLILAAPIRGVTFGEADERVLPAGDSSRQAIESLKADFPALSSAGVQVVLRGPAAAASSAGFSDAVAKVPGVAAVTPAGAAGNVVALTATLDDKDPFSTSARDVVDDIRALAPPAGTDLLVGGTTARNVDSLQATADRLPLMIALLVGATLILMFLAFGSILLPIKAVVVSALSLAATFGILVWIFQDGHGAGLLDITPAPPEVGIVVLMAAVVFGLSTDYEVFLLSRMVEARTRGATTAEAVTTGLARTGRVISAAALLLIVVTGAFALSTVTTMRFVGIGMIIALVLDATVVRMVLVPAILSLLGNAAWWAPGPLRRLQEKAGLSEYAGEELFPTVSVGRHAAPEGAPSRYATTGGTGAARPRHASDAEPALVPAWAAGSPRELPATQAPSPADVTATGLPSTRVPSSADVTATGLPELGSVEAGIDVPAGEHEPVRDDAAEVVTAGSAAEIAADPGPAPTGDQPKLRVPGTSRTIPGGPSAAGQVPTGTVSSTPIPVPIGDLPVVTSEDASIVPVRVPTGGEPDEAPASPAPAAPAPASPAPVAPAPVAPASVPADEHADDRPAPAGEPPETAPAAPVRPAADEQPDAAPAPSTPGRPADTADTAPASSVPSPADELPDDESAPAGEQPQDGPTGADKTTARVPTGKTGDQATPSGDAAPAAGPAPDRAPQPIPALTGEHGPIRITTGEQPHVRVASGEHGTVRIRTGEQPAVPRKPDPRPAQGPGRTNTGEQPVVPVISGKTPPEPDDDNEDLDASELRTVDLASRMSKPDDEEPDADATAVLDMGPTVDLSSRLEQEGTQRRR